MDQSTISSFEVMAGIGLAILVIFGFSAIIKRAFNRDPSKTLKAFAWLTAVLVFSGIVFKQVNKNHIGTTIMLLLAALAVIRFRKWRHKNKNRKNRQSLQPTEPANDDSTTPQTSHELTKPNLPQQAQYVATSFPKIARDIGFFIRVDDLTGSYKDAARNTENRSGTMLGVVSSLQAHMELDRISSEPGVFIDSTNHVCRAPLVIEADGTEYTTTLWLYLPVGMSIEKAHEYSPQLAHAYQASAVTFLQDTEDRNRALVRMHVIHADPLENITPLTGPLSWTGNFDAVPFGFKQTGGQATLKLRDVSGTVIGGLPGGGKTAGLSTLLATLAPHNGVQFYIFDGKGGHDWSWLEPRATLLNRNDEDRELVAEQLEQLVHIMRKRLDLMPQLRGGASFWNIGGPTPDMPLLVIVVDECQTYLDSTAVPRGDKEAAAARARCETAIATLVRKGRSAGIWVVPTTQKPTSDSLPTTIGSNAASAIAFRVKTAAAETAIFGEGVDEGETSARDLPAKPGYAIIATEEGNREVVRFGYIPEPTLNHIAQQTANLRSETVMPDLVESEVLEPDEI